MLWKGIDSRECQHLRVHHYYIEALVPLVKGMHLERLVGLIETSTSFLICTLSVLSLSLLNVEITYIGFVNKFILLENEIPIHLLLQWLIYYFVILQVFKGKKMPGHLGGKQRTVKNLSVYKVDSARNLMGVRPDIFYFQRLLFRCKLWICGPQFKGKN